MKRKRKRKVRPKRIDLTQQELAALLARVEAAVAREDYEIIQAMAETIALLSQAVEQKGTSINRLLKMIFGSASEKTRKVLDEALKQTGQAAPADEGSAPADKTAAQNTPRKGHGRNGADQYPGAQRIHVPHASLHSGELCPICHKGKVYELTKTPGTIVRVVGQAPLQATVYELQKLRCNLCNKIFTADPPEGVGKEKYDAAARSMIALLKYGSGFPFYRLEQLQAGLGMPLPASTQWDIVEAIANGIWPAFAELKRQGAQGDLFFNDDTLAKILALINDSARQKSAQEQDEAGAGRTGVFTSAILSRVGEHTLAIFSTGPQHAGEHLTQVLTKRHSGLDPPIQMCDALSRNQPKNFQTILANCLAHGRRRFVDVVDNFPDECRHVLQTLAEVYCNDAICQEQNLSPEQRLRYHQTHSNPLMEDLHGWMSAQLEEKRVEPNSGLGQAITYMLKHWEALTLFLRVSGAPLDNNLCEQALKRAILHRKNSLFFKTEHGAHVGDLFMSLIHTCRLCEANPFDYLTELQKHSAEVFKNPAAWMPWNYQAAIATSEASKSQ